MRGLYKKTVDYFATHPDSGIVIRIKDEFSAGIEARISLNSQLRSDIRVVDGNTIVNDGYVGYASLPSYYNSDEKFAYDPHRGIHFRTKVKVVGAKVEEKDGAIVVSGQCHFLQWL